jgi:glycosyltransferase involved in cell wall biosynthesis
MKKQANVSVIVCTYNRSAALKRTLSSLDGMSVPDRIRWELIIVNNNSTDETLKVVSDFAELSPIGVRCVLEMAQGLSHARNRGIQEAKGDLIVFTDDDITVDRFWLGELIEAFESGDAIAAGGKVIPQWSSPKPKWFYQDRPYSLNLLLAHFDLGDEVSETSVSPCGANMAFRRTAFIKYGLFRTDLGRYKDTLISGEDTEFFARLLAAGEKIAYSSKAIVYHPVPRERTEKHYAESFFFHGGRTQFRVDGIPSNAVLYFGIPRYFVRAFVQGLFCWIFCINSTERFRNKMRVYHTAGMIVESRKVQPPKRWVPSRAQGS